MSLVDRFRAALRGRRAVQVTSGPRLALVPRRPLLALPAPPGPPRRPERADPLCTACGRRHPALAQPAPAERVLLWPAERPVPLGRQATVVPARSAMRPQR
jgi:hypothetical protein